MSYDLTVFNPQSAPKTKKEFMNWYNQQSEWEEKHDYNNPQITSDDLRKWFLEMKDSFPALNGPFAFDNIDDPKVTDYCIGEQVIYAAFSWSEAKNAYPKMLELAIKYNIGFFDTSGNGDILFPNGSGEMTNIASGTSGNKSWWKFWS